GEARPERAKHHLHARLQPSTAHRFVQRDCHGRGRRVPIPIHVDVHLVHRDPGVLRGRFDDPDVRLVRNQEIDVAAREPGPSVPGCRRPPRPASSSAVATDAADVFPYRSTLTCTLSIGTPACFAVASMIRMFAWCGIKRSMSPLESPARSSVLSHASAIERTAALNTSRPAILM